MNKVSKVAVMLAGLAIGAHAGLAGIGWDNGLGQATARLGVGANAVDVGVGLSIDPDNGNDDAKFLFSGSGIFLGHLHDWGPVDTYFYAGGLLAKTDAAKDNVTIAGLAGFQPEVTLLDHIVLSARVGISLPLIPAFRLNTAGQGISIVEGANFKILF